MNQVKSGNFRGSDCRYRNFQGYGAGAMTLEFDAYLDDLSILISIGYIPVVTSWSNYVDTTLFRP